MKRYVVAVLSGVLLLCSCGKKAENKDLHFPEITWDMSMEEVMDACQITKEEIKDYGRDDVFVIEGYTLFGEKTESVRFQFYDFGEDGSYELTNVFATYPKEANMESVAEEMKKAYGEPNPNVTFYYPYSALEILKAYEPKEPDSMINWALGSVAELIPAQELDAYREPWESYQYGLNEENWDKFIHDSRQVRISLLTDEGWNRVEFDATNLRIYEAIKRQISEKQ